eukprot:1879921-Prymnesium_polylepis.1
MTVNKTHKLRARAVRPETLDLGPARLRGALRCSRASPSARQPAGHTSYMCACRGAIGERRLSARVSSQLQPNAAAERCDPQ